LKRFSTFALDEANQCIWLEQERVTLQPKPFAVLAYLAENPGRLVTKEELLERVWADASVEEGTLTSHVSVLRKALGEGPESAQYIETIPKRGYRFVAPLRISENGLYPTVPNVGGKTKEAGSSRRLMLLTATGVLLMLVGAAAGGWFYGRHRATTGTRDINSIAVLPLINLSGDPAQEYFADGMTDELITTLAKINSLRVISRTSAMRYKNVQKPLPEIAQELNVDAIVEGSVSRSGNRVRITAQLIDGRTDRHLWAEDYERSLDDTVAVQNQIARAVVEEVRAKLTPRERLRLSREQTVNPVAYEAYLKGRFHWNKRTESELKVGIDYFERAVAADPQYSLAYVGLADSYNILGSWVFTALPADEARSKAVMYANKALTIDDTLGEAYAAQANAEVLFDWDWARGEAGFKRAIDLNPNYANAHHWYAELLMNLGRFDESIRESYKAKELDPLAPLITASLAERLTVAGRVDQAIKEGTIALELDPNSPMVHVDLGMAYAQQKNFRQAIEELSKAVQLSDQNPNFIADLGYVYAAAGERAHAQETLKRLEEISRSRYVPPYQIAAVYAALGEKRKAAAELDKAFKEHSAWMINLRVDPRLESLRSEPEFKRLVKALRFPDAAPGAQR